MDSKQQGSTSTEGTNVFPPELNGLPQAGVQRLFDLHQSQAGDAMEAEWLAQQEAAQRAWFNALFNPCGVE